MDRKLIKVAKDLRMRTSALIEILNAHGFQIENKPTSKVSEDAFKVLISQINKPSLKHKNNQLADSPIKEFEEDPIERQHIISVGDFCDVHDLSLSEFLSLAEQEGLPHRYSFQSKLSNGTLFRFTDRISLIKNIAEEIEKHYPLGTIIESEIVDSVYPQGIKVRFDLDYTGYIELQNISSSIFYAEHIFNSFGTGKLIECVVYRYDHINKVCHLSIRHLIEPKPASLQRGDVTRGRVIEQLKSKSIVLLENGEFGISNMFHENPLLKVLGYNELREIYRLEEYEEKAEGIRIKREKIKYNNFSFIEPELTNYLNFEKSSFGVTATLVEKNFLREQFRSDKNLFTKTLRMQTPVILKFINDRSWEEIKREAGEDNIKEAFELLSKSDYWVRYQSNERYQSEELILFNEKTFIKAKVEVLNDEIIFIVDGFSIGRTNKWSSSTKKYAANSGALLNQSNIIFLSPYDNIPFDSEQEGVVESIRNKFKAFDILKSLKERTGVILQTEGEALKIFENFLEYQIFLEKEKEREPLKIEILKKFPSSSGWNRYAIQTSDKLDFPLGPVDIGEKLLTKKEKSAEAYVQFASGRLVEEFSEIFLEVRDTIDLTELNKDIHIRESLHVFHIESQKEIIQDFLNKKINVAHIEKLLVDPDSIKSPKKPKVKFNNPDLEATFLNDPQNKQIEAVIKGVGNRNILLIQGPPGTGKTTVIVEIVEQLIEKGEKILISSQGHVAVDNVLEKFADSKSLLITRIGSEEKIDPSLVKFQEQNSIESFTEWYSLFVENQLCLVSDVLKDDNVNNKIIEYSALYPDYLKDTFKNYHHQFCDKLLACDENEIELLRHTLEDWKKNVSIQKDNLIKPLFYKHIDIAFGTCLGLKNSKDLKQYNVKFDTLILDEAGKANMAETFIAISLAKKVILVGDQKQLPPYLDSSLIDPGDDGSFPNSKLAQNVKFEKLKKALSTSFFEFLVSKIHKGEFPEANLVMLDVQHRMHPSIGNLVSESFYGSEVQSASHTKNNRIILPSPFDKEIVFVDTSNDSNPYERKINEISYINELEAAYITKEIIPRLLEGGVDKDHFAIISPYKYQVYHIKERLAKDLPHIEVNVETLDSFQGKEFDIIIISFTRSSKFSRVGFLDDARRLNVALSRAKKKLILVGNAETLCSRRSHFDKIFNYTELFEKIILLSSNNETGNFFQLSDQFSFIPARLNSSYHLSVGDIINGKVKKLEDYGAFIDLGRGITGLCYISDLSYSRINSPSEVLSEGDEIRVKVISIEEERISLGIKQLSPDPWEDFIKKHEVKQIVEGKVVEIKNYGAFIEIIPGVEGLIHQSEIFWNNKLVIPNSYFKVGEKMKAALKSIDLKNRKIALSIKELTDPWKSIEREFRQNTLHSGVITSIQPFGVFVQLSEDITGLLHASKLSEKNPIKSFKVGQPLDVYILSTDSRKRRISLGLTQPNKSSRVKDGNKNQPTKRSITLKGIKITVGQLCVGRYSSEVDGYFQISLFEGVVGFLKITEDTVRRIRNLDQLPEGFKIIKVRVEAIHESEKILLTLD